MSLHPEKLFVQYPNFRSSTYKYDPCVVDKSTLQCEDCRIQIISDRFLGPEFMSKVMKGTYNYPYVLIADTAGCNMRCWFCYSWHFWSNKLAEEQRCRPVFISAERLADEFYCKIKLMSDRDNMLNVLEKKSFLTSKELGQSRQHIRNNFPLIRIRVSGGEPVFASRETFRPFESDKPVGYSLGISYWLTFFEHFNKRVAELKDNNTIHMVPETEWSFESPWLSCLTERPGRMNVRFDTNGIAFADPILSRQLVDGIYDLHKQGRLDNIHIMIDYSLKGATPTEFEWSQNKALPVDPSINRHEFELNEHPQIPGLLNLRKEINKHTRNDPKFNDCLSLSIEKGIEHGRNTNFFVNYEGSMDWDSLAERLDIKFSPVSNEIDIASAWRWEAQIKRYMKQHSHARVLASSNGESCDSDAVGIDRTIRFIWENRKQPGFKVEIMPSEKIEKPKSSLPKERGKQAISTQTRTARPSTTKAEGYIFSGSPSNWQAALRANIWGLEGKHQAVWERIEAGNPVFFYATSLVSGLIGWGTVQRTFVGTEPYWPDELRDNQVKYPYRIEFIPGKLVEQESWKTGAVKISHLGPIYFSGINPITSPKLINTLNGLVAELP